MGEQIFYGYYEHAGDGPPEYDPPHDAERSRKANEWCDSCRWWGRERAHDDDVPVGRCRVMPPTSGEYQVLAYHDPARPEAAGPLVRRGAWPWTAFDDWCAKFSPPPKKARP